MKALLNVSAQIEWPGTGREDEPMTKQEENARETAMLAERHWWVSQITRLASQLRANAEEDGPYLSELQKDIAIDLDDIIAERTR